MKIAGRAATLRLTAALLATVGAAYLACDEAVPERQWFYLTSQNSGLPSDTVYGIVIRDNEGWYATGAGLACNRGSSWDVWTEFDGLPISEVLSLCVCPNGDVWGTTVAGVFRLRDGAVTIFTRTEGLPSDRAVSVAYDGAKVWVATEAGVARFDDPGWTVIDSLTGLPGDDCRDVYPTAVEKVWIACLGGAALYDHGVVTAYTPANAGLPSYYVYAVAARGPDVWLGTDNGLSLMRNGHVETTYYAGGGSGLKSSTINDLTFDAEGRLWAATLAGASQRVGDAFHTYGEQDGMTDDYVICASPDKYGNMWFGTLTGGVNRYGF